LNNSQFKNICLNLGLVPVTAMDSFSMKDLLKIIERDILQAKNYYADMLKPEPLEYVWTGNMIKKDLHIEDPTGGVRHVIPERGKY
jgi:hypothetical protein